MTIRFNEYELPEWVSWLAQDADGTWWGYEIEPLQSHNGWYENEVGRCIKLMQADPNQDWQQSLLAVSPDNCPPDLSESGKN